MRFAFISTMNDFPWGGSEELWSRAALQLRAAGHEVKAWVMDWPQPSAPRTALVRQGIPLETVPSRQTPAARRVWNKLSQRRHRLHRGLTEYRPDLVILSQGWIMGGAEWARVCRRAAIPYIVIVHCNAEMWWFQEQLASAVESYTGARKVLCVSQANLDLLRLQLGERLPAAEIVRNPYNVSPDLPASWPDESGGWKLACVARLDLAAKGQDLLLQTLSDPRWRSRSVEVNLFGSGPDEPALRRMVEQLGLENVQFRGHVFDVAGIWEENHLLVLPSRYEGLPLALVEAMWCRRPAVVTDAGGNRELCIDGQTGFVASAPKVPLFADALERAWERRHDWKRMGEAARMLAEEQIPRDPVALFCRRLEEFAGHNRTALH